MRVTRNMMTTTMLTNIQKLESQLLKHQAQIASNKRILAPSDDPIGTSQALSARTALSKNEQLQRNVLSATNWLELTESGLDQMYDVFSEINVLMSSAGSDVLGDKERHGVAMQVSRHIENLMQSSKTTFDGKYIFGGYQTKTEPFSDSNEIENESFVARFDQEVELDYVHIEPNSITVTDSLSGTTYQEGIDYTIDYNDGTITALSTGSMNDTESHLISYSTESMSKIMVNSSGIAGNISRQIGEDVTMEVNVPGDELFTENVNLFNVLIDLRNKIERDDTDGVRALGESVQNAIDHIVNTNGDVGARLYRLNLTTEFLEEENITLLDYKSSKEEVNITETTIKFQSLSLAYQQALSTTAEIMKSGLMNYIS